MSGDLEERVREACLPLEDEVVDMGPGLRKGLMVRREFDCHDGCVHGSPLCAPGRGGYHGCAARRLVFYVSVPGRGGVGFDLYAPIYLSETVERMQHIPYVYPWEPMGSVDLHIVDPKPQPGDYRWGTYIDGECIVSGADHCWCDGTTMQADVGVEALLRGGREGVWSWLAEAWLPDAVALFGEEI